MFKKRILSLLVCAALIAGLAVGCGTAENPDETAQTTAATDETTLPSGTTDGTTDVTVLGEGVTVFAFTVKDLEGNTTDFEIHTDKTVVGEALEELSLLSGEEGPYGLYVKEVNGITADYETDGSYWAFYINGEYALTGVDVTDIAEGDSYMMCQEKG